VFFHWKIKTRLKSSSLSQEKLLSEYQELIHKLSTFHIAATHQPTRSLQNLKRFKNEDGELPVEELSLEAVPDELDEATHSFTTNNLGYLIKEATSQDIVRRIVFKTLNQVIAVEK